MPELEKPTLDSHIGPVKTVNDSLKIERIGEPGAGGAFVAYDIAATEGDMAVVSLRFQNGMPKDVGVNGITNEVLAAILIDRFEGFQKGNFPCPENEEALRVLREALQWMKRRSKNRDNLGPK